MSDTGAASVRSVWQRRMHRQINALVQGRRYPPFSEFGGVPKGHNRHTNDREETLVNLFKFAIVKDEKVDKDAKVVEEAQILVEPTHVLARDAAQASIVAARAIRIERK